MRPRTGRGKRRPDAKLTAVQEDFLKAFELAGTVTGAARQVGIHRTTHYEWMALDKHGNRKNVAYAEAFENAEEAAVENMVTEARRRGMAGTPKYAGFYQGVPIEEIVLDPDGNPVIDPATKLPRRRPVMYREWSDNLLMFCIKAKRPEYRDKFEISGPGGQPLMQLEAARKIYQNVEKVMNDKNNSKSKRKGSSGAKIRNRKV